MCEILDSCTQWEGSGGMTKCEGTTKEQALRNREKREALVRDERVKKIILRVHFGDREWQRLSVA